MCASDSRHSVDRSVFNPPLRRPRHSQVVTSTIRQIPKGRGGENEKEREEKRERGMGERQRDKTMRRRDKDEQREGEIVYVEM